MLAGLTQACFFRIRVVCLAFGAVSPTVTVRWDLADSGHDTLYACSVSPSFCLTHAVCQQQACHYESDHANGNLEELCDYPSHRSLLITFFPPCPLNPYHALTVCMLGKGAAAACCGPAPPARYLLSCLRNWQHAGMHLLL